MSYNIAVIGATGVVGSEFLKILETSDISINKLKLFASEKSVGKIINFRNKPFKIRALDLKDIEDADFAIFCAGSSISKQFIPKLKGSDTFCIDLSSAFRMDKDFPLIIPEINGDILKTKPKFIASPNCTTTIMLMAIHKLHKAYNIKKIQASTYQAASGGGKKLMDKLIQDTKNALSDLNTKQPFGFNLYLHESPIDETRYNQEEIKVIKETHKILNNDKIKINATCVRVPVIRAHSISMNVEFEKSFSLDDVYKILYSTENVQIVEDYKNNKFATPNDATGKNEILISRIRKDITNPKALDMWVCGDQILKGASLNALQILESLIAIL
ncbi:MAG: aspartate-semialdehyde dehydrogenase [Parachlamydiales bacterium]|jgi:aspartate-semialdehyde dehydrogenase